MMEPRPGLAWGHVGVIHHHMILVYSPRLGDWVIYAATVYVPHVLVQHSTVL